MSPAVRSIEIHNALWPQGAGVIPPDQSEDAFWHDVNGRAYALPEIVAGADPAARRFLRERHIEAIETLLAESLQADEQGCAREARAKRHRARRLIGEIDGWWVDQAQEARANGQ